MHQSIERTPNYSIQAAVLKTLGERIKKSPVSGGLEVGANVVVGVDLDYVEMSSAGYVLILVASGATVVVEELVTNILL